MDFDQNIPPRKSSFEDVLAGVLPVDPVDISELHNFLFFFVLLPMLYGRFSFLQNKCVFIISTYNLCVIHVFSLIHFINTWIQFNLNGVFWDYQGEVEFYLESPLLVRLLSPLAACSNSTDINTYTNIHTCTHMYIHKRVWSWSLSLPASLLR